MSEASETLRCPKCGMPRVYLKNATATFFICDSMLTESGNFSQTHECRLNELERAVPALKAENERLREAFMASADGTIRIRWNPDGFWAYHKDKPGREGPHYTAIDAALAALTHPTPEQP